MTTAPAFAAKTKWSIDSTHSSATFSVRHLMISNVRGEFQKLSGEVLFDPEHPESAAISATIDVSTVNTREAQRDAHLKSPDFFDAANFPNITFVSKSVKSLGDGNLEVRGDLTIRGTSREVVLAVEGPSPQQVDPWGNVRIGATATGKIKRSDFGITWNTVLEAGGVVVGDVVSLQLDISLVRQK